MFQELERLNEILTRLEPDPKVFERVNGAVRIAIENASKIINDDLASYETATITALQRERDLLAEQCMSLKDQLAMWKRRRKPRKRAYPAHHLE